AICHGSRSTSAWECERPWTVATTRFSATTAVAIRGIRFIGHPSPGRARPRHGQGGRGGRFGDNGPRLVYEGGRTRRSDGPHAPRVKWREETLPRRRPERPS